MMGLIYVLATIGGIAIVLGICFGIDTAIEEKIYNKASFEYVDKLRKDTIERINILEVKIAELEKERNENA